MVVWPNGLALAPEVLHGDYPPNGSLGFEDITARQPAKRTRRARLVSLQRPRPSCVASSSRCSG